jgi:glycerophosphoryl diester phosphodiesterase
VPNLRACKYVDRDASVRALAAIAGMPNAISVRDLILLLGDKAYGPRPIYILGHNTNTIEHVKGALGAGANALEIDVTAYETDLSVLCVDHAGLLGDSPGSAAAPRFDDFLMALRDLARGQHELALVVLDCKPPAATPQHGPGMLGMVRRLFSNETGVNVIISVSDVTSSNPYRLDGTSLFDKIALGLGPREGLMIDQTDNPDEVAAIFRRLGFPRFCYGYGTSDPLSDQGAMVYRHSIERACWMSATLDAPRFVYAWTVNDRTDQEIYLEVGVNGIIADPDGIANLKTILGRPENAARYRLAARSDNPLLPANAAYGLTVVTSDIEHAGTDANLTFTLTGANATAAVTIDSNYNERMEQGSTNFVVLPAPDLGTPQSITVSRDDSGNAPDWHLASIEVQSRRYGGSKKAMFDCWIGNSGAVKRALI